MNALISECNRFADPEILKKILGCKCKLFLEGSELKQFVENSIMEKELFLDNLRKRRKIYIFGAGAMGRKVASFIKINGIEIASFIVSDHNQNDSVVDNIAVNEINYIDTTVEDYLVVVATSWFSRQEIIKKLGEYKINNIYPIDLRSFFLWQDRIES